MDDGMGSAVLDGSETIEQIPSVSVDDTPTTVAETVVVPGEAVSTTKRPRSKKKAPVAAEKPSKGKKGKTKAQKTVKATKGGKAKVAGRGRPKVYTGALAAAVVKLLKENDNNASIVMRILRSKGAGKANAELIARRKAVGFDEPQRTSLPTIYKIGKAAKINFEIGRPKPEVETKSKKKAA